MSNPDWRKGPWAVLDLETTGLGPTDCIVEIAILHMRNGNLVNAWSTPVNPMMPIPPEATAVHGITDEMVAGLPTLESYRATIEALLAPVDAIVGYNLYGFDEGALLRELPGIFPESTPLIDPLVVVRSASVGKYWKGDTFVDRSCPICDEDKPEGQRQPQRKGGGRHSLSRVAERLEIGYPEPGFEAQVHRAAWDALLAGRALAKVMHFCSADGLTSEARMRAEKRRQDAEGDAFRAAMRAEDAAKRERRKVSLALRVQQLEAEVLRLAGMLGEGGAL